jgi:hypothetical protein
VPAAVRLVMLATLHRAPILAVVGLFAATLARMPRDATPPVAPAAIDGCPTAQVVVPTVIDSPNLIYISGPDRSNDDKMIFTPPDREPALR